MGSQHLFNCYFLTVPTYPHWVEVTKLSAISYTILDISPAIPDKHIDFCSVSSRIESIDLSQSNVKILSVMPVYITWRQLLDYHISHPLFYTVLFDLRQCSCLIEIAPQDSEIFCRTQNSFGLLPGSW